MSIVDLISMVTSGHGVSHKYNLQAAWRTEEKSSACGGWCRRLATALWEMWFPWAWTLQQLPSQYAVRHPQLSILSSMHSSNSRPFSCFIHHVVV